MFYSRGFRILTCETGRRVTAMSQKLTATVVAFRVRGRTYQTCYGLASSFVISRTVYLNFQISRQDGHHIKRACFQQSLNSKACNPTNSRPGLGFQPTGPTAGEVKYQLKENASSCEGLLQIGVTILWLLAGACSLYLFLQSRVPIPLDSMFNGTPRGQLACAW